MAKVYDTATDLITFARGSSGTALRRVGYGENLVADFSTYADQAAFDVDWTRGSGWTFDANNDTAIHAAGSGTLLTQSISMTLGKVYQATCDVVACSGGTGSLQFRGGGTTTAATIDVTDVGSSVQVTYVAEGNTQVGVYAGSGTDLTIDNISVKEVIFDRATDPLVLFDHPDDIPRIEYGSDGSLKGLLIEEQRTNLFNYSNDPNLVDGGGSNLTVSANTEDDPAGSAAASLITAQNAGSFFGPRYTSGVTGRVYTASFIVKNSGSAQSRILVRNSVTAADITVSWDGATLTSTTDTSGSSSMKPIGENYYRISVTYTAAEGTQRPRIYPDTIDGSNSLVVYAWQLEEGSFATSYIPTSGSTVTRSPDLASIPVSAFGYNQSAGTVVVDFDTVGGADIGDDHYVLSGGNTNSRWAYHNTADILKIYDGANAPYIMINQDDLPVKHKFAVASDASSVSTASGGSVTAANVTSTGNLPALTTAFVLGSSHTDAYQLNGHIKSLKYYPRRLTDAQLQELTA